ncbi:MAG: hypothetical protein JNK48_22465 [Bryobacterales bacterium]|nr:hypothetical protein [Bryobacterales bacterium]
MGLTAETVQVYSAGLWPANLQNRIADFAVQYMTRQGYEEAAREEDAERILAIAPVSGGGWISVYDSDFGAGEKFAKELSKAILSPAVSLTVFDSDDVFIRLFEAGKMRDRHEYSGGKLRKRANAGNWSSVTDPDQRTRIQEILTHQSLFAEEQLLRLAEALGMSAEQCVTPIGELPGPEEGFLRFYFRHPRQGSAGTAGEGPPRLVAGPSSHPWRAAMGEQLPHIGMYAVNQGGAAKGIHVRVEGSALDDDLVALTELTVFNTGRKDIRTFALAQAQREVEIKDFLLAEAPLAPRGVLGLAGMLLRGRGSAQNRMDHYVSVSLKGSLRNAGQGDLRVIITPLANRDGAAHLVYPILVQPRVRGPRKADLTQPGSSERCRHLYSDRILKALLSFQPGKDAAATFAAQAIGQWLDFLERTRPDGWFCSRVPGPLQMPQFLETQRNNLRQQKKWNKWMDGLAEAESLMAHIGVERREGDLHFEGCAGLGFHLGEAHTVASLLSASPHLSLWLDTAIFTDDEVEEGERLFASLASEAAASGLLLQGSIFRNLMSGGGSAEWTAYEFASGVQGQCTMTAWWCERFLRSVGGQMWIGPQLLARIPSLDALRRAASTAEAGNCLYVKPDDPRQTEALEEALDAILSGSAEWQQGMRVRFNRETPG